MKNQRKLKSTIIEVPAFFDSTAGTSAADCTELLATATRNFRGVGVLQLNLVPNDFPIANPEHGFSRLMCSLQVAWLVFDEALTTNAIQRQVKANRNRDFPKIHNKILQE